MNPPLSTGDLCTRAVVVVDRKLALNEAARLMREQHVGCVVVVEQTPDGRFPVGLLTDRDIVTAVVAQDIDVGTLCVEDVMSAGPVMAREADSLLDTMAAMQRAGVRRVPVTDAAGALQGLLALDDVIEIIGEQISLLVRILNSSSRRELQRRS